MASYTTRDEKVKMNYQQAMKSRDREIYKREVKSYLEELLDREAIQIVPRDG